MLAIGTCLLDHSKPDHYKQCATSIYNLYIHMYTHALLNTTHTHISIHNADIFHYCCTVIYNLHIQMHTRA